MAVRFSASGQHYSKAFGVSDACTVCCWVKITTNRSAKSGFFSLESATTNFMVGTDAAGTGIKFEQTVGGSGSSSAASMTVGNWYRIGVIHTAASTPIGYSGPATGTLTATTLTGFAWSASASIKIGCEPTTANFLNGCIANFKAWDTSLSVAELTAEFLTVRPQRWANLSHYHEFIGADNVDYCGLNRNLTGGSGATSEAGPPIPRRLAPEYMIIPPVAALPPLAPPNKQYPHAVQRSYSY